MGLFNSIRLGSSAAGDYEVERSVRFVKGDYHRFTRTPSSEGDRKTWTWSAWIKRGSIGNRQILFSADNDAANATYLALEFQDDDNFRCLGGTETQSSQITKETQMVFRDTSAWYHLVFVLDATNSSAKLYVNGDEVTNWNTNNNPTNQDYQINATTQHFLGRYGSSLGSYASNYFDGYMAEVNFIDGTALTPSSFAETDAVTGEYKPKQYTGGYGTNGFYLNFSDNSSTSALGTDSSGNGNNFTPNNFSVSAGAGNDSLEDTPTNNFPTLNVLDLGGGTSLANGNLDFSTSGAGGARSTFGMSSGKYYAEVTLGSSTLTAGLSKDNSVLDNYLGNSAGEYSYGQNGNKINGDDGSQTGYGDTFTTGDTIGIAFDADGGNLYFYKNGSLQASGTAAFTGLTDGPYFFAFGNNVTTSTCSFNFGQRPFANTIPTGYKALNSANLPDPTIKKPNQHFNTVLWTGNGTNGRTISGVGFDPDLTWIKCRSDVVDHLLYDTVRGGNKVISSNDTAVESSSSQYGYLSAFASDGFTLTQGTNGTHPMGGVNHSGRTYAAWNWKAGGSTATNNDGSIETQVRANTSAGFSIVTFSIASDAVYTVGHGLGVAPKVIIMKARNETLNWDVFHASVGNTKRIKLNSNDAPEDYTGPWNDTDPTSTVFTSTGSWLNGSGTNVVAYCFSEVAGYSKFGSYTGNGNADGTFVFTGFRPAYVLVKDISNSYSWDLHDNKRDPHNVTEKSLAPNLANAEDTYDAKDFLANGFKLRSSSNSLNKSGDTYIYLAFAESPFKYARAR